MKKLLLIFGFLTTINVVGQTIETVKIDTSGKLTALISVQENSVSLVLLKKINDEWIPLLSQKNSWLSHDLNVFTFIITLPLDSGDNSYKLELKDGKSKTVTIKSLVEKNIEDCRNRKNIRFENKIHFFLINSEGEEVFEDRGKSIKISKIPKGTYYLIANGQEVIKVLK